MSDVLFQQIKLGSVRCILHIIMFSTMAELYGAIKAVMKLAVQEAEGLRATLYK